MLAKFKTVLALFMFAVLTGGGAQAVEVGEDGLHKQPWFSQTFRDIKEDMAAAKAAGKRLAIIIEQRGCGYCKKLHEEVLSDPEFKKYASANFMMVQYNMFGDEEVIDTDGETLTEKSAVRRWGLAYTPTIIFLPEEPIAGKNAREMAVNVMPGAFGKGTVIDMFTWVRDKGYLKDEPFQKYHQRMYNARLKAKQGG